MSFEKTFDVRWADVDANGHMRHSAYYDYGAHMRLKLFDHYNYPLEKIMALSIGLVLFREEARFYKEFHLNQEIKVDCAIKKMRRNGKIWCFQHQFFNSENQLAAVVIAEGTWIDLKSRKAVTPPDSMQKIFYEFPRTEDFSWLP